ncbi:hypothetical protein [Streptomyces sp. SGAir0957]
MANQPPKVIGVLTTPAPPTWWRAHRHQVLGTLGLIVGFWAGMHLTGDTDQPTRQPLPGHSSPPPATPSGPHTDRGLPA